MRNEGDWLTTIICRKQSRHACFSRRMFEQQDEGEPPCECIHSSTDIAKNRGVHASHSWRCNQYAENNIAMDTKRKGLLRCL